MTEAGIESPRLDAEVLLMHVLGIDRTHLYVRLRESFPQEVAQTYIELIARRARGEPVAYLTGHREFMGLDFLVRPRVLIPRPETEGLVTRALGWLKAHPDARRVVDVGTGSGAIAISVGCLVADPDAVIVVGSDVSAPALDVAKLNLARHREACVHFVRGNLLDWCTGPIDLILANLPYLREEQRHEGISHEPDLALYADKAGFARYEELIPQAVRVLATPGAVMCEIDPQQREVALHTAQRAFSSATTRVEQDLSGRDRYLMVSR